MIHALSAAGRQQLAVLAQHGRALLAFDFDGTLAPVVAQPAMAAAPAAMRMALSRLGQWHHTAVISGRGLADLQPRIAGTVATVIGNHGAEGAEGAEGKDARVTDEIAGRCRAAVAAWRTHLVDGGVLSAIDPHVVFEDKGLSASLHYRHTRNPVQAAARLCAAVAALKPMPRVITGKAVLNLLAADSPDKARAFVALREALGAKAALFVGDDDTDEVVFDLVQAQLVTVRVGYRADSAAQLFVRGTGEVLALLRLLARQPH